MEMSPLKSFKFKWLQSVPISSPKCVQRCFFVYFLAWSALFAPSCTQNASPPDLPGLGAIDPQKAAQCRQLTLPESKLTLTHIENYLGCVDSENQLAATRSFLNALSPKTRERLGSFLNTHFWQNDQHRKSWSSWFRLQSEHNRWQPALDFLGDVEKFQLTSQGSALLADFFAMDAEVLKAVLNDVSSSFSTGEQKHSWSAGAELLTQESLVIALQRAWKPSTSVSWSESQFWKTTVEWARSFHSNPQQRERVARAFMNKNLWTFFNRIDADTLDGVQDLVRHWTRERAANGASRYDAFVHWLTAIDRPFNCLNGQKELTSGADSFFAFLAKKWGENFSRFLRFELMAETSMTASLCIIPNEFSSIVHLFREAAADGFSTPIGSFSYHASSLNLRREMIDYFTSPFSKVLGPAMPALQEKNLLSPIIKSLGSDGASPAGYLKPLFNYLLLTEKGTRLALATLSLSKLQPTLQHLRPWMMDESLSLSKAIKWGTKEILGHTPHAPPTEQVRALLADTELAPLLRDLFHALSTKHGEQLVAEVNRNAGSGFLRELVSTTALILGGAAASTQAPEGSSPPRALQLEPHPQNIHGSFDADPIAASNPGEKACDRLGPTRPTLKKGSGPALLDLFYCNAALSSIPLTEFHAMATRLQSKGHLEPFLLPWLEAITGIGQQRPFEDLKTLMESPLHQQIFDWLIFAIDHRLVERTLPLLDSMHRKPKEFLHVVTATGRQMLDNTIADGVFKNLARMAQARKPWSRPQLPESHRYSSEWDDLKPKTDKQKLTSALQTLVTRLAEQPHLLKAIATWIEEQKLYEPARAKALVQSWLALTEEHKTIEWRPLGQPQSRSLELHKWDTMELLLTEGDYSLGNDAIPLEKNLALSTLRALAKSERSSKSMAKAMRHQRKLLNMGLGMKDWFSEDERIGLIHLDQTFDLMIELAESGELTDIYDLVAALYKEAPWTVRDSKTTSRSPLGLLIDLAHLGFFSEMSRALWSDHQAGTHLITQFIVTFSSIVHASQANDGEQLIRFLKTIARKSQAGTTHTLLQLAAESLIIGAQTDPFTSATLAVDGLRFSYRLQIPWKLVFENITLLEKNPALINSLSRISRDFLTGTGAQSLIPLLRVLEPSSLRPLALHWLSPTNGISPFGSLLTLMDDINRNQLSHWNALMQAIDAIPEDSQPTGLLTLLEQLAQLRTQGELRRHFASKFAEENSARQFLLAVDAWRKDPAFIPSLATLRAAAQAGSFQTMLKDTLEAFE